jgi:hypothetical protein
MPREFRPPTAAEIADVQRHGPIMNPVDRFVHLPEETRKWLEQLRPEDLKDLDEARRFHHDAKAVGRFAKWLALGVAGAFLLAAQFGDSVVKLFGMLFRGAK